MKRQLIHYIPLLTALTALIPSIAHAQLKVVATTPDFGSIAEEIGGDKVEVVSLARATEDPHFVDAKPSFVVKLNRADVLIEGGAELEVGWLPALLEQSRNPKIANGEPGHIRCSPAVDLVEVPTTLDRSQGDVHAAGNPHYMIDPVNALKVAGLIGESLCRIDKDNCGTYQLHLKSFSDRLQAKIEEWQKTLAPFAGARIVAYHNSWPYFAHRFHLNIDLFLEPKPGIPPTPANLASVIVKMRSENLKVIIVDPYLNRRTAETVAEKTGASVLDVSQFPGGLKNVGGGYIELVDHIIKELADALGKK